MSQTTTDDPHIDALLDCINTLAVDDEEAQEEFVEAALEEAISMLTENLGYVADADADVQDVLTPENVRDIETENNDYRNPRMTVWLRDCPIWANDAERRTFYVGRLNDRDSKVTATIDVRPF